MNHVSFCFTKKSRFVLICQIYERCSCNRIKSEKVKIVWIILRGTERILLTCKQPLNSRYCIKYMIIPQWHHVGCDLLALWSFSSDSMQWWESYTWMGGVISQSHKSCHLSSICFPFEAITLFWTESADKALRKPINVFLQSTKRALLTVWAYFNLYTLCIWTFF